MTGSGAKRSFRPFPAGASLPGFCVRADRRCPRLPSCSLVVSVLSDKLSAKENCVLAGHVVTDFVDHLFRSECRLAILTAAGFPAGHSSVAEDIAFMEHIAAAEQVPRISFKIEIAAQRLRHLI